MSSSVWCITRDFSKGLSIFDRIYARDELSVWGAKTGNIDINRYKSGVQTSFEPKFVFC